MRKVRSKLVCCPQAPFEISTSQRMTEYTDVPADTGQHMNTSTVSNGTKINPFHINHKLSCTYQGCHCHKFTMTEWNSRWIQAWESGINEARQVGRQKVAGGLVPIPDISLNAHWELEKGRHVVQRSDSSTMKQLLRHQAEGVCCLEIFVREILVKREREIRLPRPGKGEALKFEDLGVNEGRQSASATSALKNT